MPECEMTIFWSTIEQFQTLIAALIAGGFAISTAVILYFSALIPAKLEDQRFDKRAKAEAKAAKAIIGSGAFDVLRQLNMMIENAPNLERNPEIEQTQVRANYELIEIPPIFRDMTLLMKLDEHVISDAWEVLARVTNINRAFVGGRSPMELVKSAKSARDQCTQLFETLSVDDDLDGINC